jgi:hypothetical protein
MWYNAFRSNPDLFKEAAASAAASYLECGSLLPLFHLLLRKASLARLCAKRRNSVSVLCKLLSLLDATLAGHLVCVANKGLTHSLSPLDATFTKNGGVAAQQGYTPGRIPRTIKPGASLALFAWFRWEWVLLLGLIQV